MHHLTHRAPSPGSAEYHSFIQLAPGSEHVTRKTTEHLNQVEAAIQPVKGPLASHGYLDHLRTVLVIGFITQLIEHHDTMLLLIRGEKVGSAFALARSIVEGMYRGLWINFVATDIEVARFERRDEIGMGMTELARAIDDGYQRSNSLRI